MFKDFRINLFIIYGYSAAALPTAEDKELINKTASKNRHGSVAERLVGSLAGISNFAMILNFPYTL